MRSVSIAAVLVSLLPGVARSQEISTTGGADSWSSHGFYQEDGGSNWGFGQVFTVPAATTFLNTFSFWVASWSAYLGPAEFTAHLATWEGPDASGRPETSTYTDVWTSGAYDVRSPDWTGEDGLPLATFAEQVFSPRMALSAGGTYLAYLRVSRPIAPLNGLSGNVLSYRWSASGEWGLVYLRDGVSYYNAFGERDAAFTADLTSPVPEPATILLLATGLIGVGGIGLARRKRD